MALRRSRKRTYKKPKLKRTYADNWRETAARAKEETGGKCCGCEGEAKEVDHAYYAIDERLPNGRIRFVSIVGREVPGEDVFPLCLKCHKIAHNKRNWYWYAPNPEMGNRNYPAFIVELRRRYRQLSGR